MNEMYEMFNTVQAEMDEAEADASEELEEHEQVAAVTKMTPGSKQPKSSGKPNQLVPYVATKSTLTLVATHPKQSRDDKKLREVFKRVALARRADGHVGKLLSITEVETDRGSAKPKPPLFGSVAQGWNGTNAGERI